MPKALLENNSTKLSDVAVALLEDAKVYLSQLDKAVYQQPINLLSDSTIGQHSRHFIEFYQCLFDQLDEPGNIINYDVRKRNQRIQEDPKYAAEVICYVIDRIQSYCPEGQIKLCAAYPGECSFTVDTSYERELMYNIEHTIHHMAILKIGLKIVAPLVRLPEDFGVASSTVKYRNTCAQ